jgi:hypothetical protein
MNTSTAIKSSLFSKRRGKKAVADSRVKTEHSAFDRIDFDAALDRSLTELEQGLVYEVDMKNPEKSIRELLQKVK